MQPTLVIIVPVPGMIYVNGRFLGEATPDLPLFAPVSSFGAVYLEYRPLEPGHLPLARKVVMSSGSPLPNILAEDVYAIRWPSGITEIELSSPAEAAESFVLDGISFKLIHGRRSRLEAGGLSCSLPSDAHSPQLHRLPGCIAIIAESGEGRCLLTLSPDLSIQTGFLRADRLEMTPDGSITAVTSKGDIVGHAVLEKWQADSAGLRLISSEPSWLDGAPRIPSTPEETATAAVEAALLGRFDEAEQYLAPALRFRHPLDSIGETGCTCLPMKYGVPDGRPCIGLMKTENDNCATVVPIYYRTEISAGRIWLTELSPE